MMMLLQCCDELKTYQNFQHSESITLHPHENVSAQKRRIFRLFFNQFFDNFCKTKNRSGLNPIVRCFRIKLNVCYVENMNVYVSSLQSTLLVLLEL